VYSPAVRVTNPLSEEVEVVRDVGADAAANLAAADAGVITQRAKAKRGTSSYVQ